MTFKDALPRSFSFVILFASSIRGVNPSVLKLLCLSCYTAAILSKPIPVSTQGLGRGLRVPSLERAN